MERRPTESDRNTLSIWQNWGFSDEMILEACKLSVGTSRPLVYVNAILSDWKSHGILNVNQIPESTKRTARPNNDKTEHFSSERLYDKEELDALLKNVDDIEF